MEEMTNRQSNLDFVTPGSNITVIDTSKFYLGKCTLISMLLSNGVFHDYNFDRTQFTYLDNEEAKSLTSQGALSQNQILTMLYLLRLRGIRLDGVKHKGSYSRIVNSMGVYNLAYDTDKLHFVSPEQNSWLVDSIITKFEQNRFKFKHNVYTLEHNEEDINEIVTKVNKCCSVTGVNKVMGSDETVYVIDSESVGIVITYDEIIIVGIDNSDNCKDTIRQILYRLNKTYNDIKHFVML